MITYAYGQQGVDMWRECIKEVHAQRQQEIYAAQEAKDAAIKMIAIAALLAVAGGLIYLIVQLATR